MMSIVIMTVMILCLRSLTELKSIKVDDASSFFAYFQKQSCMKKVSSEIVKTDYFLSR